MLRNVGIRSKVAQMRYLSSRSGKATSIEPSQREIYKSFYDDYFKTKREGTVEATTVGERQSYEKIFDYLNNTKGAAMPSVNNTLNFMRNSKEIPVTARTQNSGTVTSISQLLEKDFSDETENVYSFLTEEYQKLYWDSLKATDDISEALRPTIQYMNDNLQTTEQMITFMKSDLIESYFSFERESVLGDMSHLTQRHLQESGNKIALSEEIQKIANKSLDTPSKPIVNDATLPILIKYGFESLTYDFDALEDTLSLFDYIKHHPSKTLYLKTCDIEVYNSLLVQIWKKTQNLIMIKALYEELVTNMLKPNLITYKVLTTIYLHCMEATDTKTAYPHLLWGDVDIVNFLKVKSQTMLTAAIKK